MVQPIFVIIARAVFRDFEEAFIVLMKFHGTGPPGAFY